MKREKRGIVKFKRKGMTKRNDERAKREKERKNRQSNFLNLKTADMKKANHKHNTTQHNNTYLIPLNTTYSRKP